MNIALWIVAVLAAVVFVAAGAMKVSRPKPALVEAGLKWVDNYSAAAVKAIGVVEILGAIGLIVPAAVDVVPVLVPIAAIALAVLMVLAAATHARRAEWSLIGMNVVLLVLTVFVAVGRLALEPF